MSRLILAVTAGMLMLPVALVAAGALTAREPLVLPALFLVGVYAWVWLRFRPIGFVVSQESIDVIWPLKRRAIRRETISSVRLMDRQQLRGEIGWGVRVGAGGLWGGFGWLWTTRRGIVRMYVSRTDRFVWIERTGDRPWLITPDYPDAFLRALATSHR
jgi:hypothetical protein